MARVTWLEWGEGLGGRPVARDTNPTRGGLPQMTNQRASRVSFFVVVALAVLAVGAFVPKALAAQRETRCCVIEDRKSTRLNSSHDQISYAVFCLKKKKKNQGGQQCANSHRCHARVT